MNKITGECPVDINGRTYTLRFDWTALAAVESEHGSSPNLFSPAVVASVAAAGFKRTHPELTAERITELSPPLVPLANAVQHALTWAYFGAEAVPEGGSKKKRLILGWWQRISRLFGRG